MKTSERVQSLIDAHKYDEAIQILARINNPKATDWIRRIEALQVVQKKKEQQRGAQVAVWLFFACILSCGVIWVWGSLFPERDATQRMHIIEACAAVMSVTEAIENCNTDYIMEYHAEAVAFCEQHYDENSLFAGDLYAVCLKMEGVDMGF